MLISPLHSLSSQRQTDNVFLVLPLRRGLLVEVPCVDSGDMNGGKQLSRESSPEEDSNKNKGPEMEANLAYSKTERGLIAGTR